MNSEIIQFDCKRNSQDQLELGNPNVIQLNNTSKKGKEDVYRYMAWSRSTKREKYLAVASYKVVEIWYQLEFHSIRSIAILDDIYERICGLTWNPIHDILLVSKFSAFFRQWMQ